MDQPGHTQKTAVCVTANQEYSLPKCTPHGLIFQNPVSYL